MAIVRDPIAALAITMQARKGAFALLLGSGISRSAQIPTGWDIVKLLIQRLATANGEVIEGEPDDWYSATRGRNPSYSDLLDELAPMPAERSQLIRPFIEPSADEADLDLKQPTEAHRAIARLVTNGYVRVIVTTNFDRLLETSLADAGIVPTVISSADGVAGSFPLAHNRCTIIKIHGDYMDARIRNTSGELERYDPPLVQLLEQVFREYGVIISGWSADWDIALREILCRSVGPWFSSYWVAYSEPKGKALEVIEARSAQVVSNMSADEFFTQLEESVQSVADLTVPELVSSAIAVATMKRYVDDPTRRTRIFDMLVGEARRVRRTEIIDVPDGFFSVDPTADLIVHRLERMESATSTLRSILTTLGYWGRQEHAPAVTTALEQLGNHPSVGGNHYPEWAALRFYPALLGIYAFGLGAVLSENWKLLWTVLTRAKTLVFGQFDPEPLVLLATTSILDKSFQDIIGKAENKSYYANVILPMRIREKVIWDAL